MTRQIELLSPVGQVRAAQLSRAPRLNGLEHRDIVLLDNTKQNTDLFMDQVERELLTRFGVQRVRRVRKFDSAKPAQNLDEIGRVDAVVNGIGD